MKTSKTYSPALLAEAAMCIWEFMLGDRDDDSSPEELPRQDRMRSLRNAHGTVEMRHYAIRLAPIVLEVYDTLGDEWVEQHGLIPYDWEFVPAVVRLADFTDLYAADNRPERIASALREHYERHSGEEA